MENVKIKMENYKSKLTIPIVISAKAGIEKQEGLAFLRTLRKTKPSFPIKLFFLFLILIFDFFILHSVAYASMVNNPLPLSGGLQAGLVGWWTFDGVDMKNNVVDKSGSGNTGYLQGFTSTSSAQTAGKIGQALKFDGVNDYLRIPTSSSLNITGALTVSLWVKTKSAGSTSNFDGYISKSSDTINQKYFGSAGSKVYEMGVFSDNKIYFQISDGVTLKNVSGDGSPIEDGEWHMVTGLWNGTTNTNGLKIYFDGVLKYQATAAGIASIQSVENFLEIGGGFGTYTGVTDAINSSLDDVRIYNRALSATEITQLYNQSSAKMNASPVPTIGQLNQGLVGWWTFDGVDMKNNVVDKSGAGNTGSIFNVGATSTAVVAGKIGQAFTFKRGGATGTANNRFVSILQNSGLQLYSSTTPYSISMWTKEKPSSAQSIFWGEGNNLDNLSAFYMANASGGKVQVFLRNTASVAQINSNSTRTVFDNSWHHIMWTDSMGVAKLYIDGVLDATNFNYTPTGQYIFNRTSIGQLTRGSSDNSFTFNGSIDDVRIFNRALSAIEIRQLYNQSSAKMNASPVPTIGQLNQGLVGWWTFDGVDMKNNVVDKSGSGNTGYLQFGSSGNVSTTSMQTSGKIGQALNFDGVDDYIMATIPEIYNLPRTFSLWMYLKRDVASMPIISIGAIPKSSAPQTLYTLSSSGTNSSINVYTNCSGIAYQNVYSSGGTSLKNKWVHFVATYDGSTHIGYINGVQALTKSGCVDPYDTTNNFYIGVGYQLSFFGFYGLIDDVRLYNRVLTATEVRQLYNMGR